MKPSPLKTLLKSVPGLLQTARTLESNTPALVPICAAQHRPDQ